MSGGEQQMLAMGRALMARPKVLLLDEPSMGLSPIMVDKIFEVVADIHSAGHHDPAGRAERQPRAGAGRPRLRDGVGRDHDERRGQGAAGRPAGCARPTWASDRDKAGHGFSARAFRLASPASKSGPVSRSPKSASQRNSGLLPMSPLMLQVTLVPAPAGASSSAPLDVVPKSGKIQLVHQAAVGFGSGESHLAVALALALPGPAGTRARGWADVRDLHRRVALVPYCPTLPFARVRDQRIDLLGRRGNGGAARDAEFRRQGVAAREQQHRQRDHDDRDPLQQFQHGVPAMRGEGGNAMA